MTRILAEPMHCPARERLEQLPGQLARTYQDGGVGSRAFYATHVVLRALRSLVRDATAHNNSSPRTAIQLSLQLCSGIVQTVILAGSQSTVSPHFDLQDRCLRGGDRILNYRQIFERWKLQVAPFLVLRLAKAAVCSPASHSAPARVIQGHSWSTPTRHPGQLPLAASQSLQPAANQQHPGTVQLDGRMLSPQHALA